MNFLFIGVVSFLASTFLSQNSALSNVLVCQFFTLLSFVTSMSPYDSHHDLSLSLFGTFSHR